MKNWEGMYLSREQAEKITEGAGKVLEEIGIKVTDKKSEERLEHCPGITMKDHRAFIERKLYEEFMEKQKKIKTPKDKHGNRLHGEASLYTYQYRDVQDKKIKEYTMESLGEYAAFVEKASKRYPLNPVIPGYPCDVPKELSSLARYKIAAENCSRCWPLAPDSLKAAEYLFEMSQVMGQPMKHLPVYMISPLTYGGDSLEIVLENKERLDSFYTFAMPNLGVTTPMNLSMGFATALAEVAGGAVLTEALTGLSGEIRANLFPFDFRDFNIAFGSPEKFLMERMAAELAAYIHEEEPDYSSTNIHTWGKSADGRTGMEKGMMIMAGALYGAKRFYCVGTLSLDELFDPLCMIQDLEAISFAQQICDGTVADCMESTFLEEMREGIQRGFVGSDRSLDDYGEYVKSRAFSPKETLQKWMQTGEKGAEDILKEICLDILKEPGEYELEKEKRRELDKIYRAAVER